MFTDGRPPPVAPAALGTLWLRGLDLYDHRFYWEAHEAWEGCWHHTPPGPRRTLQQALIQGAAAVLKRHLGHDGAAARLHRTALQRLDAVIAQVRDDNSDTATLEGLDLIGTRAELARALPGDGGATALIWPRVVEIGGG